jgi:sugar lactone lactonase YvrE
MCQHPKALLFSGVFLFLLSCQKKGDSHNGSNPPAPPGASLSILSINPTSGGKNTVLTITGMNFSTVANENQVFINGVAAVVTAGTPNSLTITVPAKAGTGAVTVKRGNLSATGPVFNYIFNYYEVTTLAGSAKGFADGKGALAQFNNPHGLTVDNKGNLFVADNLNNRIREIQPDGTVITISGTGGAGHIDGAADVSQFKQPYDIAFDKQTGNLYLADYGNNAIRMLRQGTAGGYTASTIAGANAPLNTPGFADGVGTNAAFYGPSGISIDNIGNLYVADRTNNRIRKMVLQSAVVTTMAGSLAGYQDGSSATALFHYPYDLDSDPAGKYVLVADDGNQVIRKAGYLADGSVLVSTLAGTPSAAGGYQDGDWTNAQFNNATSITIDAPRGVFIVADAWNNCIRIMDNATSKVRTLAGSKDHQGADDGPVGTATFYLPGFTAVDAAGNIYITDVGNHRIRKIAYE